MTMLVSALWPNGEWTRSRLVNRAKSRKYRILTISENWQRPHRKRGCLSKLEVVIKCSKRIRALTFRRLAASSRLISLWSDRKTLKPCTNQLWFCLSALTLKAWLLHKITERHKTRRLMVSSPRLSKSIIRISPRQTLENFRTITIWKAKKKTLCIAS